MYIVVSHGTRLAQISTIMCHTRSTAVASDVILNAGVYCQHVLPDWQLIQRHLAANCRFYGTAENRGS